MNTILYAALAAPLGTALLVLLGKSAAAIGRINLCGSIVSTSCLLAIIYQISLTGPLQAQMIYVDQLSAILLLTVALLTLTASLFSISYMEKEIHHEGLGISALKRYYVLFNVFSFSYN